MGTTVERIMELFRNEPERMFIASEIAKELGFKRHNDIYARLLRIEKFGFIERTGTKRKVHGGKAVEWRWSDD